MVYSHTPSVTKTVRRKHGERPSGGSYPYLLKIPLHYSIMLSVRRRLAGIVAKLEPLSEQNEIMKFLKNVDHAMLLNGFVQDLAYAVTDYQVYGIFTPPPAPSKVLDRHLYSKALIRTPRGSTKTQRGSMRRQIGSMWLPIGSTRQQIRFTRPRKGWMELPEGLTKQRTRSMRVQKILS